MDLCNLLTGRGNMDLSRLSLGDKLVALGGIILFIAVLLPWYSYSASTPYGGGSASWSLWSASQGIGIIIMLACIAGVGILVLRMFEVLDLNEQGVPESLVVLIAGGVASLFVLLRVISIPDGGLGFFGAAAGISIGRTWGLFVGVIAAALFVGGALMKFQGERA